MDEQTNLPPPPPQNVPERTGFHGPETHFFVGIRRRLDAVDGFQLRVNRSPITGLIVAFLLGITFSTVLSVLVELAIGVQGVVLDVLVAPFTEEVFKGLAIFIVILLVVKTVPNRRWGTALGALVGLGFSVGETIVQAILGAGTLSITLRIIAEPFMHPLWSAFAGMGCYLLIARKPAENGLVSSFGGLFILTGLIAHVTWNSFAVALAPSMGLWGVFVCLLVVFPFFAVILRDLLGGHFNFQNFFETMRESTPDFSMIPPPPPPPP